MTSNGRPATPQAQLMDLELQYSDLSGRYGAKHPDVVRLQRQIEVMRNQIGGVDNRALDQAKYSTLQAQLSEALQRYGEKHPEVQRLRRQLDEMKAQMAAAPAPSITPPAGPPDNPMYIQLQNQLADADSQLRGTERARGGAGQPTSPNCRSASCRPRPSRRNTARCKASTPSRCSATRASRTRKRTPRSPRPWSSRARARPSR